MTGTGLDGTLKPQKPKQTGTCGVMHVAEMAVVKNLAAF